LDKTLCTRVTNEMDIEKSLEKSLEELHKVVEIACSKFFITQQASKKAMSIKAVP